MKKTRKSKYMYGKFYHDTFEFRKALHDLFAGFLAEHALDVKTHNDAVDMRNKIVALLNSWIGSRKIEEKCGISIPLHSTSTSFNAFMEKQARSYSNQYIPCEICGEQRVTHYCHIIPKSNGGPNHEDNYIYLCPTHHHLYDHSRLSKQEWDHLDLSGKLKAAQEYALKVCLPLLEDFWHKTEKKESS